MFRNRNSTFVVEIFSIIVSLLLVSCVPATAPAASTSGGASAAPASEVQDVRVMLPTTLNREPFLTQFKDFEDSNPGIKIQIELQPSPDFIQKLFTQIAGGTQPDLVLGLSYEEVALLHRFTALVGLEELVDDDFLPDALDSNRFPDSGSATPVLRAIPWLRYGCSPRYLNIARLIGSKYSDAANALITFLTAKEQQDQNFVALQPLSEEDMNSLNDGVRGMRQAGEVPANLADFRLQFLKDRNVDIFQLGFPRWPTRTSANEALPSEYTCPTLPAGQVKRLLSVEAEAVRGYVAKRAEELQLTGLGIPVAVMDYAKAGLDEQTRLMIEYGSENQELRDQLRESPEKFMKVVAVPALVPVGEAAWNSLNAIAYGAKPAWNTDLQMVWINNLASTPEWDAWYSVNFMDVYNENDSMFVGVLFVIDEFDGLQAGDYIVKCWSESAGEDNAACQLRDFSGNRIDPPSSIVQNTVKLNANIDWPFATYEEHSPGAIRFWVDGWLCCIGSSC